MICVKCDSNEDANFFQETFECKCGETMLFEYNLCPDCGLMWRSINHEPMEDSYVHHDDMMSFMAPPQVISVTEEELDVLKKMEEEMIKADKVDKGEASSMTDYIHKCLQCRAVAHETTPGHFECTECDFSWEMVKFDD